MDADPQLEVDSPTHHSISDSNNDICSRISTLCEEARTIRHNICSVLGKISFSEVSSSLMIGKGSANINKQYLADSVISLASLAEKVDPTGHNNDFTF